MNYRALLLSFTSCLALMPFAGRAQWMPSPNTPIYVDAGAHSPLAAAAIAGDRAGLRAAAGNNPVLAAVARSIDKRMSGDFDGSAGDAEGCFRQTIALGNKPDVALVCAQLWASSAVLQGDLLRWADITQSTWDQVRPQLVAITGKPNLTVKTLATAQAVRALPGKGAMSVKRGTGNKTFPLAWQGQTRGPVSPRAYIDAVVDGKTVHMLVDTGSEVSVLSTRDARTAGIETQKGGIPIRGMKDVSTAGNGLGFVNDLNVANLTVRNARLLVVDTPDSILGMDLLGRMGEAVRIRKTSLDILPSTAPEVRTCNGDIQITADFTGFMEWALTFPVQIDGKREMPFMDSGNNGYISLYADNSPLQTSSTRVPFTRRTINANKDTSYAPGKVSVETGSKKVQADLMIFPKTEQRIRWSLGSGVLNDFDIVMDLGGHHACLTPAMRR